MSQKCRMSLPSILFRALGLSALLVCVQCGPSAPKRSWKLLEGDLAAQWVASGMEKEGASAVKDGELSLKAGEPMTGMRYQPKAGDSFPPRSYELEYETMRSGGADFFGSVTFPAAGSHLTLILGGWGGSLVGISNIDGEDASNNRTTGHLDFVNDRWYRVRIELRDEDLRVWIDRKLFVNVNLRGRGPALRPGEIEKCLPLGFASYLSDCRVRGLVMREL